MRLVRLEISGMTCEHCARTIKKHLEKAPGLKEVRIDWESGRGEVVYDPKLTGVTKILRDPIFQSHYSARVVW